MSSTGKATLPIPFRIMVVDDEYYIREGICNAIAWESIGARVAGEASSGSEALNMLDAVLPDVIITDICMDDMDGLSFAENVKARYPHTQVIVLSGYDNFEFAKRAVELRVFRYILKPGNPEKILQTVREALDEICVQRKLVGRINALEKNQEMGAAFLRNTFFDDVLNNRILDDAEMGRRTASVGVGADGCFFCAAILRMDAFYDLKFREDGNMLYTALTGVREIAQNTLEHDFSVHFAIHHSRDLIILAWRSEEKVSTFTQRFIAALNEIRKNVRDYLKNTCTIGVGAAVSGLMGVYVSCEQAKISMDYKFSVGNDCIISISDIPTKTHYVYPKGHEKKIITALNALDTKQAVLAGEGFVKELANKEYGKTQLRAILSELFASINRCTLELGIDLYQLYEKEWIDPSRALEQFTCLNQISNLLANLLAEAVCALKAEHSNTTRSVIRKAQELIAIHYANPDLSLSMIADQIFLNATYLSKLYKAETGETYVDYLTRYRMDAAKELLRGTNLKISDVGDAVGYPNTQYFSTLFKRLFTVSPVEYRERRFDGKPEPAK